MSETRFKSVMGQRMAYVEIGEGDPIVLLHGNPTSKFLWRNVIPHVADKGRCIAPDLVGMGESAPLPNSGPFRYTLMEHYRYLRELLYQLEVTESVTLVIHDWGSALGFHWANEHRDSVKGICFMESIVRPLSWAEWPDAARSIFQGFRSDAGEDMILNKNLFVERVLPGSLINPIAPTDMASYRQPFLESGESRRPTLTWPRQIPIDGEPPEVVDIVNRYGDWLKTSDIPKLFINTEPGVILKGEQREFCRSWPNVEEVSVEAGHFVPEDVPHEVGTALREWLQQNFFHQRSTKT